MAKTSYIDIVSGLEAPYKKALQSGDRFTNSRVTRKIIFSSRKKLKGLTQKSLLPSVASAWALLDSSTQLAWSNAGVACGLNGYKCFLKDKVIRLQTGLSGNATPSILHQDLVGRLSVASPATSLKIAQLHPFAYYIYKKVTGTKSQYNPVKVEETFTLPVTIEISYKSVLSSVGGSPRARFYLDIESSYQSEDLHTILACDFSLSHDWERKTATLLSVKGLVRGYTAYIEIFNARGDLCFDDVAILHGAHNWARDPNCNNIQQDFTKQFAQIPRHWVAVDVENGAEFLSVYGADV